MASIDCPQLRRLLDDGAQLVEALPAGEYAEMHLPDAVNIRSRPSTPPPQPWTAPARWSSITGTAFET